MESRKEQINEAKITAEAKYRLGQEIAEKLHVTMATVAFHRNNISEKLGSRSLGHLTIYAVMHGIVKIDEL